MAPRRPWPWLLAGLAAASGCDLAQVAAETPRPGRSSSPTPRPVALASGLAPEGPPPTPASRPSVAPGAWPTSLPPTGPEEELPPGPAPGAPTAVRLPLGATEGERALDLLNQSRALVGLPAVVADAALAEGAQLHARYMILNFRHPALEGLKVHQEDASLPGATPEGAQAAQEANIGWGLPVDTTLAFLTSLYHRGPVLSASLEAVGLGFDSNGAERDATVLRFRHGRRPQGLIAYPAAGQTEVQLGFGGETPQPLPPGVGAGRVGYPITLSPPSGQAFTEVAARLLDGEGHELPCYLSDEARPAADFPQGGAICLFPQERLRPGATHQVEVSARLAGVARRWRWAFRTEEPRPASAADPASLASRVLHAVRLQGEVVRTTALPEGGLQLQLATAPDAWVQVVVPAAWKAQASAFTARRIEAMGVCVLRGRRAYELELARPEDLKVLDEALPLLDATDDAALHRAAGQLALVRGKLERAGTLPDGTVWLAFMPAEPIHTAFVPAEVWAELKLGDPSHLVGRILTVRAQVRSTRNGTTIELNVTQPDQLSWDEAKASL